MPPLPASIAPNPQHWPHPEHPIWPPEHRPCPPHDHDRDDCCHAMKPPFFPPWWFWPPPHGCFPTPPGPCVPPGEIDVIFSPSAPTGVIKQGQFWWNGTTLQMWDGTEWQEIGPPDPSAASSITGVTDGSNADPGCVGEFITGSQAINFAAAPAITQMVASPLVVPPGDWDLSAWMSFSGQFGMANMWVTPQPAGLSNNMAGYIGNLDPNVTFTNNVVALRSVGARGSFSNPTVIPFYVQINNHVSGALAGIATLTVDGRRRR